MMNPRLGRLCFLGLLVPALLVGGCASRTVAGIQQGKPEFDPMKYFAGRTHSAGVFETRSGRPKSVIETATTGRVTTDGLRFEQDVVMEKGTKSHRSWLNRRVDGQHYSATGTGIVGVARGTAYGNVFHLEFTMDALKGNPLGHVRMSQWMYLQADGRTMINRAIATKGGVTVAEMTECFRKD